MTQRMILIQSPFYVQEKDLESSKTTASFFDRTAPLALEIGCGIGDFIVKRAAQEPEMNFVALDIYNKGCYKTCNKIEEAGIENVRVARAEARHFLDRLIEPGTLSSVYINCPDPWPKKRHRKRRLVNRAFLEYLLYMLKPEGELFFSTDFVDYGIDVANELSTIKGYDNLCSSAYVHHLEGYPLSKYMRRFLDMGQPIYYCNYRRNAEAVVAKPNEITKGFRSLWADASND